MDYFQGVVIEYLRPDRSVFVNTECLINLDEGDKMLKARHWYCDAMAVNFKQSRIYLCEISYSATLHSLISRLQAWQDNWSEVVHAIIRDSGAPASWQIQPWIFIPQKHHDALLMKLPMLKSTQSDDQKMPTPRVTHLESTLPWEYKTWDRKGDAIAYST